MKKLDCIVPDEPGLIASKGEYMACAFAVYGENGEVEYILNFHKGLMPAYAGHNYDSLEQLEVEMREFEPDFRKWRVNTE